MLTNVLSSFKATVRNYRLVLLIWAGYAALAAVAVAPALHWWRGAFDYSIEAATLLRQFNLAVVGDLTKYDYVGAFGLLTSTATAALALSIVASSFVVGGTLNVISGARTSRGVMDRFFSGGSRFFWRFIRLMFVGGTCLVLAGGLLMLALVAIESPFSRNTSEQGVYLWLVFNLAALAIACALFLLALDYARIEVVIDDTRGMVKAYLRALGFVLRHAASTYGMALAVLAPLTAVVLGYVAYETVAPVASTWGAIVLLVLIQQATLLARVGLRVSLLDAEYRYARRLAPGIASKATPATSAAISSEAIGPPVDSPSSLGQEKSTPVAIETPPLE